jgi:hypothetical protein
MANRYGEAALMAARLRSSGDVNPVARWESAMENLYPTPGGTKEGLPAWGLSRSLRSWLGEGHTRRSLHSIEGQQGLRGPCRRIASQRNPELVPERTVEGGVE